jgi:hypothetical protein
MARGQTLRQLKRIDKGGFMAERSTAMAADTESSMTEIDYIHAQMKEGDEWKTGGQHSLDESCRDLEQILRFGLRLFNGIKSADETWTAKVQSGEVAFDPGSVRTIRKAYEWWLSPCVWVLEQILKLEDVPYEIAGADEFRRAWRYARNVTQMPVDDLLVA